MEFFHPIFLSLMTFYLLVPVLFLRIFHWFHTIRLSHTHTHTHIYICIYIYIYIYIYTITHIHECAYTHRNEYRCEQISLRSFLKTKQYIAKNQFSTWNAQRIYIYIFGCLHVCMYVCMWVCLWIYIYIYIYSVSCRILRILLRCLYFYGYIFLWV